MDIYGAKLMEFEKYLKSNNLVPENKIKYFSNWADNFLYGINYKVSAIDQNSIICFINSMRKDQRYEDWQIRQAESAVRMYVRNFLNLNTGSVVQEKPAEQKNQSVLSWQEAILKIKECMRIRAKIISNIFSLMKKYTMIYTHVAQKKLAVVESPLDRLGNVGSRQSEACPDLY